MALERWMRGCCGSVWLRLVVDEWSMVRSGCGVSMGNWIDGLSIWDLSLENLVDEFGKIWCVRAVKIEISVVRLDWIL